MTKLFFILFLITMSSLLGFQVLANSGIDKKNSNDQSLLSENLSGQELFHSQENWQKTHDRIVNRGDRLGQRMEMVRNTERTNNLGGR